MCCLSQGQHLCRTILPLGSAFDHLKKIPGGLLGDVCARNSLMHNTENKSVLRLAPHILMQGEL